MSDESTRCELCHQDKYEDGHAPDCPLSAHHPGSPAQRQIDAALEEAARRRAMRDLLAMRAPVPPRPISPVCPPVTPQDGRRRLD